MSTAETGLSVLDQQVQTQSHRLRRESRNRRSSGRYGASGRKTDPRFTRMGPSRRSSDLRWIRRSVLRARPIWWIDLLYPVWQGPADGFPKILSFVISDRGN